MSRRSRSASPRRGSYNNDRRDYSRRDRDNSGSRREEYHRRESRNEEGSSASRRPREHDERPRRGYGEKDRERERVRDRDRYDSRKSNSPRSRSEEDAEQEEQEKKAKPNFGHSGLLAADTNTVKAVDGSSTVLKYNEPPEARKPVLGWRLYVYKGDVKGGEPLEILHIHRQSAYLIGRDRLVADIAVDHPSCSKQHAVIQYRYLQEKDEFGASKGVIKPFIIDLESTNGTHVNDAAIPVSRYYELKIYDVIRFGQSTRDYILLHDEAQ